MESSALLRRIVFAMIAIAACTLLSLRPIPSVLASNDTGRYVELQKDACQLPPLHNDGSVLPERVFRLLARPICWTGEMRLLLFIAAVGLPLALAVFGDWTHNASLLIALGYFFSAVSFELITNAMRQGAGLAFLIVAASCRRKIISIPALLLAVALHDSNWVFLPLMPFLNPDILPRVESRFMKVMPVLVLVALGSYSLYTRLMGAVAGEGSAFSVLSVRYEEGANASFQAFMIVPVVWIAVVRLMTARRGVTRAEVFAFLYSLALMIASTVFFPTITYRFAMTALVLQAFLSMRATNNTVKAGMLIFFGLVAQLAVYAALSRNFANVLHG